MAKRLKKAGARIAKAEHGVLEVVAILEEPRFHSMYRYNAYQTRPYHYRAFAITAAEAAAKKLGWELEWE